MKPKYPRKQSKNRAAFIRRSLRKRIKCLDNLARKDEMSGSYMPEEADEISKAYNRCKQSLELFIQRYL